MNEPLPYAHLPGIDFAFRQQYDGLLFALGAFLVAVPACAHRHDAGPERLGLAGPCRRCPRLSSAACGIAGQRIDEDGYVTIGDIEQLVQGTFLESSSKI